MLPFLVIECGHELVKLFPLSVNIGGRQHGLLAKQNDEELAKFILVKLPPFQIAQDVVMVTHLTAAV